jgi:hypothetical protein
MYMALYMTDKDRDNNATKSSFARWIEAVQGQETQENCNLRTVDIITNNNAIWCETQVSQVNIHQTKSTY